MSDQFHLDLDANDPIVAGLLADIGDGEPGSNPTDRLEALLRLVFEGSVYVRLISERKGRSPARVFKAQVAREDGGQQVQQIIKIGKKEDMDDEEARWNQARKYLRSSPHLFNKADHSGWAVLDYRSEGTVTLSDHILGCATENRIPEGQELLRQLFEYLHLLHGQALKTTHCNLVIEEYPLKPEYFAAFAESRLAFERRFKLSGLEPFGAVDRSAAYWRAPHRIFRTLTHAAHGDLHANNIMFDPALCAIDFGHFAFDHHFLLDHICLEADLTFRLLSPSEPNPRNAIRDYRKALEFLHSSFHIDDAIRYQGTPSSQALVRFVAIIREFASREMSDAGGARDDHIPEYFLGLLRYAISRAGQPLNRLTDTQRWVAGHAANFLERHLEPLQRAEHCHIEMPNPPLARHQDAPIKSMPHSQANTHDGNAQPLTKRYIDYLKGLLKAGERLNQNADLKTWIAHYILQVYGARIFRNGPRNVFFESGSSMAYLAKEVNEYLQGRVREASLETNNIYAWLEFALMSQFHVSLYPAGPPEEHYGATFGPLKFVFDDPFPVEGKKWTPNLPLNDLNPIRNHFESKYRNNGIIFMTASGIDFSNAEYPGPHVSSYANMLFKRVLLESGCPTMMVLDETKTPMPFEYGNCFPVCLGGNDLDWHKVCAEVPFAVAIGLSDATKFDELTAYFRSLGLVHRHPGRAAGTPTGLIFANDKFEDSI